MNKTILYTIRCIKQTGRNVERMSIIFLIPFLFIVGIAFMYGDESSFVIIGDTGDHYKIGVINHDQGMNLSSQLQSQFNDFINSSILGDPIQDGFGTCFIKNINQSRILLSEKDNRRFSVFLYSDFDKATKAVQSRFISLCFIIPDNFTPTLITGFNHRINITENKLLLNTSEYFFSEANIELIGDHSYARFTEATTLLEEMLNSFLNYFWVSGLDFPGKFVMDYETISTLAFTEFDIYVPAFLIFVLITSSTGVAGIIGYEQEQGTIDRLKLSDFSSSSLLFGLSITQIITTLLTMTTVVITIYFLEFPFQGTHQALFVLIVSLFAVLPLLGISLGIAAFLGGRMATYLPGLIAIPLSFLTGGFIPLPRATLTGDIQLWHLNPFYSAGEVYRKILILNLEVDHILLDLILLLIFGIAFFVIGALVFIKGIYSKDRV
ncbi:MAG: ABC transporter permease [Candidatus Heimdallarchaeota archaeon]|nr:MAG: ABC transporter permease [Candidatus Heimdallarchaeota archaeon]